jgi:type II secretory pathway component PulF
VRRRLALRAVRKCALALDRAKLRIPLVRDIFAKIYLTRLLRVMGISLERGVTILATLEACRAVVPQRRRAAFILATGSSTSPKARASHPASSTAPSYRCCVRQMIATGEATGTLGRVMGRVADAYDAN